MKNKKTLLAVSLSLVLLIAAAALMYNFFGDKIKSDAFGIQSGETETVHNGDKSSGETAPIQQNNAAPDFKMTDINGKSVSLSSLKGKPVVLNFWASWCGVCKTEMPHFENMYRQYKDDINFVMLNLTGNGETTDRALSFIKENNYSFPVYFDDTGEGAVNYGIFSIPTTYFIDADGNIVVYAQGAIDLETLKKGIDMIYTK